jgi:hypothetical protein
MTEISHERCSELLPLWGQGRLDATDSAAVESHLATCEECARERAGMNLLVTTQEVETLTDDERARLRNAVAAAMVGDHPGAGEVVGFRQRPARRARLWPALRVAAVAAVVVAGFVFVPNLLTDDGGTRTGAGVSGGRSEAAAPEAARESSGPEPVFVQATGPQAYGLETEDETAVAQATRAARPEPPYTRSELRLLGRSRAPFTKFAASYTVEDAERLAGPFLEELAVAAPTDDVAGALRTCGGEVLAAATHPTLPAYAAHEAVDDKPSLVLGFVSSATAAGPLDRYEIWVWANADCESLPTQISEPIRPAD